MQLVFQFLVSKTATLFSTNHRFDIVWTHQSFRIDSFAFQFPKNLRLKILSSSIVFAESVFNWLIIFKLG